MVVFCPGGLYLFRLRGLRFGTGSHSAPGTKAGVLASSMLKLGTCGSVYGEVLCESRRLPSCRQLGSVRAGDGNAPPAVRMRLGGLVVAGRSGRKKTLIAHKCEVCVAVTSATDAQHEERERHPERIGRHADRMYRGRRYNSSTFYLSTILQSWHCIISKAEAILYAQTTSLAVRSSWKRVLEMCGFNVLNLKLLSR